MLLKGVDGLKTGSSPRSALTISQPSNGGATNYLSRSHGSWWIGPTRDGEYYRHPFGNALIEKAFCRLSL